MSKCSVLTTSKSKERYCTLLRPKYWPAAGATVASSRVVSASRTVLFIGLPQSGAHCTRTLRYDNTTRTAFWLRFEHLGGSIAPQSFQLIELTSGRVEDVDDEINIVD